MKERILAAYRHQRLRVVFTVNQLDDEEHFGEAVESTKWILINPRKPLIDVVKTLVHEAVHILEPEYHHNRVYAIEKDIWNVLSSSERQHLLLWALDNGFWRDC